MDELPARLTAQAQQLGFDHFGISPLDHPLAEQRWLDWLNHDFHGSMDYMARHGLKRSRPHWLVPGTSSVICVGMNYWPGAQAKPAAEVLADGQAGYIARYALGRDYHKLMRNRLQQLAQWLVAQVPYPLSYRVFCDSAPVLEKPLAQRAGLGWTGKHTNLIANGHGSWFLLGEIYVNLALPASQAQADHCGTCQRCIKACPTKAIVSPYQLDARRCISYWTIEAWEAIPLALRQQVGNRIYGCDDCQLVCPWNRFAEQSAQRDFFPRHGLDWPELVALLAWDETTFLQRTEGSPIRRLTHVRWLRNLSVALGNGPPSPQAIAALQQRLNHPSALVKEHCAWALQRLNTK